MVKPDMEDIRLVTLSLDDVTLCERLSSEAGWNQTVGDWHLHLQIGTGLGLKTPRGALVGTGILLPVGYDVGWIAMILVDGAWRRRGLGTRIMKALVEESPYHHLALDATEFGQSLYHALGFRALEEIIRFKLDRDEPPSVLLESKSAKSETHFTGVASLLADRSDVHTFERASAQALVRPGRLAIHIGPLTSGREMDAEALVKEVLESTAGDVFIDVPTRAGTFCRRLQRIGFSADRSFTRMSRGRAFLVEPGTFAIAGPEYG